MARPDRFAGLSEFLAVAGRGSFSGAAADLRVTPAAVSQAIKSLELRIGTPLFLRTTRSVSMTEAGKRLRERLAPAAADISEALAAAQDERGRLAGHLRLSVPRIALDLAVVPVLPAFRRKYPDISIEIDVNDASIDLTAGEFDAGIRIGHFIERDMTAVRLTDKFRWCVLGSPKYLAERGVPRVPEDLLAHECIGYRFPTSKHVYRWQFNRKGRAYSIDVAGGTIVNDHLTMIDLAKAGVGLAYTADLVAADEMRRRELLPVLESYYRSGPGLYLYYHSRSQMQPKLRAFIDFAVSAVRDR